ncbi:5'-AMP-activated protein kinase beta subunit, interation domain-containing protein [Sphaerosporella brunnea]|uniref:5'-AMP-activated protein kinase beta subunit, interation domain-containing protein n=1 Tax=Sphaerosporella brunnea TaxID=1250544 RepID=A0A5J5F400_9PEZI|nr:5'-AMP-activated protein kinase beta subunit, interation domain-containing protein [Sphaerosporella brunnea]
MSAIVAIPPGTHHVKFLVDGEMRTSPSLPTAVDDTGILVNYLEVSADDMPPLHRVPTPTADESTTTITTPPAVPLREPSSTTTAATEQQHSSIPPSSTNTPAPLLYTAEIPSYLRDLDNLDDDRSAGYAAPPPPTLPMMLQKVILNGSSSMRDDASVLSIPNHAVLNHLATSSIKNSILAVSATTRYKKKVFFAFLPV